MKLDFPTRKLGSSIYRISGRFASEKADADEIVYGVSKESGITITGKATSSDLSNYILVRENTFAYNPYRINIGSIGKTPTTNFQGLISPAYVAFKVKEDIDADFLFYYLKSELGLKLINWYGNRGGVRNALRYDDLKEIDFPDINVEQQRQILTSFREIVDKRFEFLHELNRQKFLATELQQSILREAIRGEFTESNNENSYELLCRIKEEKDALVKAGKLKKDKPLNAVSDNEVPFKIPKGWMWCRLGELGYVGNGSTPDKNEFTSFETDIPFLKVYNIVNQEIDFHYKPQYIKHSCHNNQLRRSITCAGDVIMNIVGPPLGKVAIIPPNIEECNINQALVVIRPFIKEMNKWIYYFLVESTAIKSLVTKGTAGQDNISVTQSRNLPIPLPPLSVQNQIVKKIEEIKDVMKQFEGNGISSYDHTKELLEIALRERFVDKKKLTQSPPPNIRLTDEEKRLLLGGYLISKADFTKGFGRLKFVKHMMPAEYYAGTEMQTAYHQHENGPYDKAFMQQLAFRLKKKQWYEEVQVGNGYTYKPLANAGEIEELFNSVFADKKQDVDFVISLMNKAKSSQAEIIATVYAVWNDLLLNQMVVNEGEIKKYFFNWSAQKRKAFTPKQVVDCYHWMIKQGFVPKGNGKMIMNFR